MRCFLKQCLGDGIALLIYGSCVMPIGSMVRNEAETTTYTISKPTSIFQEVLYGWAPMRI